MHDPDVVVCSIRRPWPSRSRGPSNPEKRWRWHLPFVTVLGRRYWFPSFVTIWHREPGGRDSGSVCTWRAQRWHVHHWRIQVHPLQALRRSLLTRCSWCGGRSGKNDPVNISHSWDGPRGRWWQGEPGLYHRWCSSARTAWRTCTCPDPLLTHNSDHGPCALCGRFRKWRIESWEVKQAEDWRASTAHGEHPTADAYQRAVETYQATKGR